MVLQRSQMCRNESYHFAVHTVINITTASGAKRVQKRLQKFFRAIFIHRLLEKRHFFLSLLRKVLLQPHNEEC